MGRKSHQVVRETKNEYIERFVSENRGRATPEDLRRLAEIVWPQYEERQRQEELHRQFVEAGGKTGWGLL